MIFKNGERVDIANKESASADVLDYQEKKKYVREQLGFPVTFYRNPSYMTQQVREDGKIEMYAKPMYIPNVSYFPTEDGIDEWRYSKTPPRRKGKDGEYEFPRDQKRTLYNKASFYLGENEMDKIYFLMYKSPEFKRYYTIDDAKANANEKVNVKIKEAKIMEVFYGSNSVLLKDETKLRDIARAWNIRNVEKMTKAQVLSDLETAVREQDARGIRSIEDFIEDTQLGYYTEIGALIQKAEDLKVIKFDERTQHWFYTNLDGTLANKICLVPKGRYEYRYVDLREYLFAEKDHIARLKSLVGKESIPDEMKLDIENLESEDFEKIAAYCNKNGIALTGRGRTKAMVYADIRKFAER